MGKKRSFKYENEVFDIEEKDVDAFLKDVPGAVEVQSFVYDKDTFDIELSEVGNFLADVPDAKPLGGDTEIGKKKSSVSTSTAPVVQEAGGGSGVQSAPSDEGGAPSIFDFYKGVAAVVPTIPSLIMSEVQGGEKEPPAGKSIPMQLAKSTVAMRKPLPAINEQQSKSAIKAIAQMTDRLVDSDAAKVSFVANFSKQAGIQPKDVVALWDQAKANRRRLEQLESEYLMAPEVSVTPGEEVVQTTAVPFGGAGSGVAMEVVGRKPDVVTGTAVTPKDFQQRSTDMYELASLYNYFGDYDKAMELFYKLESDLKKQAEAELKDEALAARAPKNYIEQRQAPATQGLAYTAYLAGDRAESARIAKILTDKKLLDVQPEMMPVGTGDFLQPSYTKPTYGFRYREGAEFTPEGGVVPASRPTLESEYLNEIAKGISATSSPLEPMFEMAGHGIKKVVEVYTADKPETFKDSIKSLIKLTTGIAESVAGVAGLTTGPGAAVAIPFMTTTTTMMPPEVAEWAMPVSKMVRNYYIDKGVDVKDIPEWATNVAVLGDFAILGLLHKGAEGVGKKIKGRSLTRERAKILDDFFSEGIRPEEMDRISKQVEKNWQAAGQDPVVYVEQIKERVSQEIKPELESIEAEVTEVPPYNPPPAPDSLRTIPEGADVEMNGEIGKIERGDDGTWYFVNDKGESRQIAVTDKFNPTEKITELGIQVLPEVSEADVARAMADAEQTGIVTYNGKKYFVSIDRAGKSNPVGDRVFEVLADGTMIDRFGAHPDPVFAANRMLAITNAMLESKGLPKRNKNITPWKESERYQVEGGAIAFEPETTNMTGGKGQYVFYDEMGNARVITEQAYARLKENGKAVKLNGEYQPGYEGYEQGEGVKPAERAAETVLGEISEQEYADFIDNGVVVPERLNAIAQKVKNQEMLSPREQEMFTDKTAEINEIIAEGAATPQAGSGGVGGDVDFTAKGGNKVVDEKGEPITVFHRTDAEFYKFDDSKKGSNTGYDNTIHGFFFADKKENTEQFGKNLIEANIALKKPIDLRTNAIFNNKEQAPIIAEILFDKKLNEQDALDLINEEIGLGELSDMTEGLNSKRANDLLKREGYDGIISDMGNNQVEYIVFDKDAIKIKSKNGKAVEQSIKETPKAGGVVGGDVETKAKVANSRPLKKEPEVEELPLAEVEKIEDKETDFLLQGEADVRRKEGKYTKDGIEYKRNEPGQGVLSGQGGDVRFTDDPSGGGVVVPFKYKLIEAETLQPSHQNGLRNPNHFLPEAQPKNRADKGSIAAEDSFAEKPRFEELGDRTDAYGGAPVVNERNEVIQGNNRSAGLKKGYAKGNKIYYDSLLENAEKFGFTKNQVEGMKNPVLVREVKASDAGAIELGNYDVKDLESGGKRRIDPIAVTRRMPMKVKGALSELLFKGDDTLNAAIRGNIKAVMDLISPYLNTAQRNSIFKGEVITEAGISDLENIFKHFLFDGGDAALPELFDNLSRTQQEGLRKSFPYIFGTSYTKSIIPEIQEAILATNDFANADAGAFDAWLISPDLFAESMYPKDKYSDAAIKIAKMLDSASKQKDIISVFAEYAKEVNDKPADFFEPARQGASKKEAIQKILKADYDETKQKIGEGSPESPLGKEEAVAGGVETPEGKPLSGAEEVVKPTPAEGAAYGSGLKNALNELREAQAKYQKDFESPGFAFDPKMRAQNLYDLHQAYAKVAREAIKEGVRTIEEFARVVSATTKGAVMAFEEAMGRKAKLTLQDFERPKLAKDYSEPYVFKGKPIKSSIKQTAETPIGADYKNLVTRIKAEVAAAIDGYKAGKQEVREQWAAKEAQNKDFAQRINDIMEGLKGKVDSKTAKRLVKKALDATTPARMRKFESFADKAIMRANYLAELDRANALRSKLKGMIGSKEAKKRIGANNVAIIDQFSKIRPEDLEDFSQYYDIAERLIESNKPMQYDKVSGGVKRMGPVISNEEVANFLAEHQNKIDQMAREDIRAEFQDLIDMGIIDPDTMTPDDMMAIIDSIENTDQPITDEALSQLFERQIAEIATRQGLTIESAMGAEWAAMENKRLALAEKVLKAFQDAAKYSQMNLEKYFIEEAPALSDRQRRTINDLLGIDTSKLSKDQALLVNRTIQNVINNNSFAGADQVAGVISFNQKAVADSKIIYDGIPIKELGSASKVLRSKDLMVEKIVTSVKKAAKLKVASGIEQMWNNVAKMKNRFHDLYDNPKTDSYIRLRDKLSKRDGVDYNSVRNQAIRGMYAKMIKNFGGSELEIASEFLRHKRQVYENIKGYLSAGGEVQFDSMGFIKEDAAGRPVFTDAVKPSTRALRLRQEGELLFDVYNKLFKDANNAFDLQIKILKDAEGNVELVDRAIEINKSIENDFFESAEMDQNKIDLDRQTNYTRDRYKSSIDQPLNRENTTEQLFNTVFSPRNVKDRATGSMNKVVRSNKAFKGRLLNFNFDAVFRDALHEDLFAVSTSKNINQLKELFRSGDANKVFGNEANARAIKNMLVRAIDIQRNEHVPTTETERLVFKATAQLASDAGRLALLGVSQIAKQFIGVAVGGVMANGPKEAPRMLKYFAKGFANMNHPMLNEFNISQRGTILGGFFQMPSDVITERGLVEKQLYDKIADMRKNVGDAIGKPLGKGDAGVARASWWMHYLDYLHKQGVDIDAINFETITPDYDAAAYAEQMVSRTQNANDRASMPELYASGNAWAKIARDFVLPFSSFGVNQNRRMANDIDRVINGAKEERKQAYNAFLATAAEQFVFNAMKVYVLGSITSTGADLIAEYFDIDDEEKNKYKDAVTESQRKTMTEKVLWNSLEDFTMSGLPMPVKTPLKQGFNYMYNAVTGSDDKFDNGPFYIYKSTQDPDFPAWLNYMGMYGSILKTGYDVYDIGAEAITGETTGFQGAEVPLTASEKRVAQLMFLIDAAALAGVSDQDVSIMNSKLKAQYRKHLLGTYGGEIEIVVQKKPTTAVTFLRSKTDPQKRAEAFVEMWNSGKLTEEDMVALIKIGMEDKRTFSKNFDKKLKEANIKIYNRYKLIKRKYD